MTALDEFERAVGLHREGQTGAAEALCRSILAREPVNARALHLLGVIRFSAGERAAGIELLQQAVAAQPDYAEARFNLGAMLAASGRVAEAVVHYRRAAELQPANADAQARLAAALMDLGRGPEAEAAFLQVLALRPEDPLALADLSALAFDQGRIDSAIEFGQRAVASRPDLAPAQARLGRALKERKDYQAAIQHLRRACELDPGSLEAVNLLVLALYESRDLDRAYEFGRDALARFPDSPELPANVAVIDLAMGDAIAAVEGYRRAVALAPNRIDHWRGLLAAATHCEDLNQAQRFAMHRDFGRIAAIQAAAAPLPGLANDRDPQRRLRVGWLSSDFAAHPVAWNIEPLFAHRDRTRFETFCYANVRQEDAATHWFRSQADSWCPVAGMSDAEVAARIRADRIDVMVYLAGRFDRNRPQVAAWRPAPVQVSFHDLATSGLREMDYLIADPVLVPQDSPEQFTERVLRLPSLSVRPPIAFANPTLSPPCQSVGYVTFGSFNNPSKLGPGVWKLWGEILRRVPGARLYLKYRRSYGSAMLRDRVLRALGRDLAPRVDFDDWPQTMEEHLDCYRRVDIALDSFPFSGSTTTFEALWMGVPVVTLAGDVMAARWSASMLHTLRLNELIAPAPADYITIAVALARDIGRLTEIRRRLNESVASSLLCDGPRATRHLERLFRAIWHHWCASAKP